ncbi:MAG: M20/M25/M40 family metallo-hydrolase [Anaerolineales bacterium]|nr:M20/M25/M40 family metallo-hydrolase [Anaerolineales bacterium]
MNASMEMLDGAVKQNEEKILEELAVLCRQPSISAQAVGIEETAQLTASMLRKRGFDTQILPTNGFPVVYAERKGISDRTLLFYNHYDVQPPEPLDLWTTPPFEPEIREGKMFARGVSDDKGHFMARLAAIDSFLALEKELPCTIKFLLEGEEEIGSVNLGAFIRENKELLAADGCIWESGGVDENDIPEQQAGMRGICYVELVARTAGQDAHSGLGGSIFPNAAWRLVWALNTLKDQNERIQIAGFYDKVVPASDRDMELLADLPDNAPALKEGYGLDGFLLGLEGGVEFQRRAIFEPTCTICGLTAGYQGPGSKTVLPAEARAKIDFRLVPDMRPEDVLEQLRTHLDAHGFADIKIHFLGGNPAGRTPIDNPFLELVVQTAEEVYGVPQRIVPMSGGSGPNYHFLEVLHIPVAMAGIGYPGENIHAPDEHIRLEDLYKGIQHTIRIIRAFAEQ